MAWFGATNQSIEYIIKAEIHVLGFYVSVQKRDKWREESLLPLFGMIDIDFLIYFSGEKDINDISKSILYALSLSRAFRFAYLKLSYGLVRIRINYNN